MSLRNLTACPLCLEQTEVITYAKLYSKFNCSKCKEELCVSDSGSLSFAKFLIQGIGFFGIMFGYIFFGDLDNDTQKLIAMLYRVEK